MNKALGIAVLSAAVLGTTAACTSQAPAANATVNQSPNSALARTASTETAMSPTAASALAASPRVYVAGAWLTPQQMPLYQAGVTQWAYNTFNYGTHLGGHVYAYDAGIAITGCSDDKNGGSLASLATGLAGSQYQAFTGPNTDKILANGAIPAYTDQAAYFYHDATQAEAAMDGLADSFARCKASLTGIDPSSGSSFVGELQQTLNLQDARCWTVLARNAKLDGGETVHDCFVRSGNVVEEVHVEINEVAAFDDENFPAIDATVVSQLRQDLAAYSL